MEQHFPYLFWAYNIIWVLMAGYLVFLGVRLRRIQREIDRLRDSSPGGSRPAGVDETSRRH